MEFHEVVETSSVGWKPTILAVKLMEPIKRCLNGNFSNVYSAFEGDLLYPGFLLTLFAAVEASSVRHHGE